MKKVEVGYCIYEKLVVPLHCLKRTKDMDTKEIKVGTKIRIVKMDDCGGKDLQAREYNGREGVVEHIDSIGQLHGTWGGLAVGTDIDEIEII